MLLSGFFRFALWPVAFVICVHSPVNAAQEQSGKPLEKQASTATNTLPAAAIAFGTRLEAAAAPAVVKWARNFAKREILKKSPPPKDEAVTAALEEAYPRAKPPALRAGEVLVWYLAYQEGTKSQEISAQRVRETERDLQFLQDDLRRLENTPVPISEMPLAREAEGRIRARMYALEQQRDMYKRVHALVAASVDACVERLAARSEAAKDADAGDIRGLSTKPESR